jgi:hypothetical protein
VGSRRNSIATLIRPGSRGTTDRARAAENRGLSRIRRCSQASAPRLAQARRDHDPGPLGEQDRIRRHVKKGASGQGWCLRPASRAGRSLAPSRAYRTAPILPLRPGLPEKATHDYGRHGTTTLFAALEVATGKVTDACHPRHEEFLRFLKKIARAYPRQRLHIVADNYATT